MEQNGYGRDEMYQSCGQLRKNYQTISAQWNVDLSQFTEKSEQLLYQSPFDDGIKVFPIPLLISKSEHRLLKEGLKQRMQSLQSLFKDVILGDSQIFNSDIISEEELDCILSNENLPLNEIRKIWEGQSPDQINFTYGPDINRSPNGDWKITEDNLGKIGGTCDAPFAYECLQKAWLGKVEYPIDWDLREAVGKFLSHRDLTVNSESIVALISDFPVEERKGMLPKENQRRIQLLNDMGMPWINFLTVTKEEREKVKSGLFSTLVNFDVRAWKPKKEFYFDIFKKQKSQVFEGPLVKSLTSKGLLPFMDNIVEYYTNKEPIIKTQPTQWLRQPISYLDDDSVYKMGRSDCGRDVIIVPYLNEKEKQEALMVINDWISEGEIVVAQEFLPPTYLTNPKSRNEKFLVEIRPYGFAYGENHFHISELFAGKATSSLGDKKNNVTRGAFELVVLSV